MDVVLPGNYSMTWACQRPLWMLDAVLPPKGEKRSEALLMCIFEKDSFASSSGQRQGDSIQIFPKTAGSSVEQGLNLSGCDPS